MSFNCAHDLLNNSLCFSKNLVVPKAKHLETSISDFSISALISLSPVKVLSAIHLDNHLCFKTCKIGHVRSNRHLPPESEPRKLSSSKPAPEVPFNIGGVVPQRLSMSLYNEIAHDVIGA